VRELDDGKIYQAKIVHRIKNKQYEHRTAIKFIVELSEVEYDKILTYNELSKIVEEQQDQVAGDDNGTKQVLGRILDHQGPLKKRNPEYIGFTIINLSV
jgi:hypothetical protein